MMTNLLRIFFGYVALIFSGLAAANDAPLKMLQGAWAQEEFACESTFVMGAQGLQHRQRGSSGDTGLIISGKTLETPDARCTINRFSQRGDIITVNLSCSTQILATGISTSFRIIDQDHFEHFENAFPDITFSYGRCR